MLIDKDALLAAINALPDATPTSDQSQVIADLQAQVEDLKKKIGDAADAMSAEVAKEADLTTQNQALQSKIDQVKLILA